MSLFPVLLRFQSWNDNVWEICMYIILYLKTEVYPACKETKLVSIFTLDTCGFLEIHCLIVSSCPHVMNQQIRKYNLYFHKFWYSPSFHMICSKFQPQINHDLVSVVAWNLLSIFGIYIDNNVVICFFSDNYELSIIVLLDSIINNLMFNHLPFQFWYYELNN